MAGSLFVGAEEVVLRRDSISYAASQPISDGIEMVMQLRHPPTSVVYIGVHTDDLQGAEYWIRMNGLTGATVVPRKPEDKNEEPWLAQWFLIEQARSRGPVGLVLTAYPEVFERCSISHQAVILFARRGGIGSAEPSPSWETVRNRIIKRREAEAKVDEIEGPSSKIVYRSTTLASGDE